jgi:hypothetical protein
MDRSRSAVAKRLAEAHFRVEPGVTHIFRLLVPDAVETEESSSSEPIKLLEVNPHTPKEGIMPVYFAAHAPTGIFYPSVIVEIHPDEFVALKAGKLRLPHGWQIDVEYRRPAEAVSA